jgi:hypothetical protein
METRTYQVYKYDELPEASKQKVLERYNGINTDHDWWEFTEKEVKIELTKAGYTNPEVYFSGFWSQGDGACFDAGIDLDLWIKVAKRGKKYRCLLKPIRDGYIEGRIVKNSYGYHYSHSRTRDVEISEAHYIKLTPKQEAALDELEKEVEEDRYSRSNALYKRLEKEYEHLTSEEVIVETLMANDYDFTIDGKID